MQSTNKKKLLIIVGLIFIILIAAGIYFQSKDSKTKPPVLTGDYYDRNSGNDVSNPADKTPDNFGSEYPDTAFIGFDQLLTAGMSSGQLDLVRKGLNEYNISDSKKYSQFSLTAGSIETFTEGDGGLNFVMQADKAVNLSVEVTYPNLDSVSLTVKKDGVQQFKKDYIVNDNTGGEDDL